MLNRFAESRKTETETGRNAPAQWRGLHGKPICEESYFRRCGLIVEPRTPNLSDRAEGESVDLSID